MKVKFIKSATSIGYGYMVGNVADLTNHVAKIMVQGGYAIPIIEDTPEPDQEPEPEVDEAIPIPKKHKKRRHE